jgi:Mg2+ and Co2+ transporter CorA
MHVADIHRCRHLRIELPREKELTDSITDIFLKLIRRIQKKADKKRELLYKMAKASIQNPQQTVESLLFPVVSEEKRTEKLREL